MKQLTENDIAPYLEHLRQLPFVRGIELLGIGKEIGPAGADAGIRLKTTRGELDFLVEVKRTNLTRALADALLERMTRTAGRWILFAPYVGRPLGQYLAEHDVNHVDAAGNCLLRIDDEHVAFVQGRRRQLAKGAGRGVGVAGFKILFTILARPELLNAPVRTLARIAGVGKTAAADAINRLIADGLAGRGHQQLRLLDAATILDRWLVGYATTVRPRFLVGNYRTADGEPEALERRIEQALGDRLVWAWGGGAAAMRLTKLYRGERTTLHVEKWSDALAVRMQALPAPDGPLTILLAPGEAAFAGAVPRTVHPLLVYTELLAAGGAREREAAREIRSRYLHDWS